MENLLTIQRPTQIHLMNIYPYWLRKNILMVGGDDDDDDDNSNDE